MIVIVDLLVVMVVLVMGEGVEGIFVVLVCGVGWWFIEEDGLGVVVGLWLVE